MKLRLPQALLAALLVAASSVEAVTFTSNKVTLTDLTANQVINYNGVTYTVRAVSDNEVKLRGFYPASGTIGDLNPAITMGLNTANITSTTTADIMYTYSGSKKWGLDLYNGAYRGVWGNTTNYNSNNQGRATLTGSEVTAVINNAGSFLFNGGDNTAAEANRLYSSTDLKASSTHIDDVTFNKGIVNYVYLNDSTTAPSGGVEKIWVSNNDNTWGRLYTTVYRPEAGTLTAPADTVDATFITAGKTQLTSTSGIANINSKCGDIIIAGAGQLNQVTGVTLNRNVYIGATDYAETGDHAAASGCAIRLDAGTFANVSLIEDASIYVMYSASSTGGYITTLDLGGHNLTKKGAGTLWVNTNPLSNTAGSTIDIQGGTMVLKAANTNNKTNTELAGLTMAAGTRIALQTSSDTASSLTIGELMLNGGTAYLQSGHNDNYGAGFIINSVTSNASTILELQASLASSGKASYVVFKNDNSTTGGLTGTLRLNESNGGNTRKLLVIAEDKEALANAEVNFQTVASSAGYAILAIGSSAADASTEVSVKGLSRGGTDGPSKVISYTGGYDVNNVPNSIGGHTLLITADGEESYTFSGDMGDTLNVKMTGTGSQTLKNVGANAVADAGAGHLTISNAVGNNTVLRVGGRSIDGERYAGHKRHSGFGWWLDAQQQQPQV